MSHYCWKCGQYLANEKFSGKGHARHICKKCMVEERAHRRQILKEKRDRGEIPELKLKPVSQDIIDYVEKEIIPRYAAFDKAHQESHVRMVIEQSMKLAEHTPSMNSDMVYVIAAFHDLGLVNGRENHHKDSRSILEGTCCRGSSCIQSEKAPKRLWIARGRGRPIHRGGNDNTKNHPVWAGELSPTRQSRTLSTYHRTPQRKVRAEGLSESLDSLERQCKELEETPRAALGQ